MVGAKYLTNSDSQLNTYVYLHNAADWALEQAQKDEEGRFYNCMSANLMLAFCVEAYLNHVCEKLLPFWNEEMKKDLRMESKLRIVASYLKIGLDYSKRPFQSLKDIWKFRNLVVHAKTEKIREKKIQTMRKNSFPQTTKPWWEKQCNLRVTAKWFKDTESIITNLHKAQGIEDNPFLFISVHSYVAHPIQVNSKLKFEI